MKKISMVINIYIDTKCGEENIFDHPTDFDSFDETGTFPRTFESLKELRIPYGHEFELFVIAAAANGDTVKDIEIRGKLIKVAKTADFKSYIITNSDIDNLRSEGYSFLSTAGYCEIRNLGFIFPFFSGGDYVIQIDDDELVKPGYLEKMVEIFNKYPDIYVLSGLYDEKGSLLYDETNDYVTWQKDTAMNEDRRRIIASNPEPVELFYGMGGNMMFKREFFSQICYPENVARGEDFALLLASYLIYFNGNDKCAIPLGNDVFRTYCTAADEITIIHKQPYSEKSNREKYLKLNFIRFIMQRRMAEDYIDKDKYFELSKYMYKMTMPEDLLKKIDNVSQEAVERGECSATAAEKDIPKLKEFYVELKKRDLFEEYKEYQHIYITSLKNNKIDVSIYAVF